MDLNPWRHSSEEEDFNHYVSPKTPAYKPNQFNRTEHKHAPPNNKNIDYQHKFKSIL